MRRNTTLLQIYC